MSKPSVRARTVATWLIEHIYHDGKKHRRLRDRIASAIKSAIKDNRHGAILPDIGPSCKDCCTIVIEDGLPDDILRVAFAAALLPFPDNVTDCKVTVSQNYVYYLISVSHPS